VSILPRSPRAVTPADHDTVVEILVESFYRDPLWGWAFPDDDRRRDQHRALWRMFVEGAARYPFTFLTDGATATSLWVPPGGTEMTDEQVAALEPALGEIVGDGAGRVMEAFDMFEQAHPHDEPHFYLSLLGTHPDHLGHGYGLGLLADNLRMVDEHGMPAYLEASNLANVPLYERYGFVELERVHPAGGPEVATMWRAAVR
jgi:GNAT superfamily N-acetyltransferase